jgi:hypothetical protein
VRPGWTARPVSGDSVARAAPPDRAVRVKRYLIL